ncbi:MAG: biotin/lipoyl-containing protein [Gemmatimonadales bacterium]
MKYTVNVRGRTFEVTVDGREVAIDGRRIEARLGGVPGAPLRHLWIGDESHLLALTSLTPDGEHQVVQLGGERWQVLVEDERSRTLRKMTGRGTGRSGAAAVRAPMPGLVIRVEVEEGQAVKSGQGVVVLEAMKMENEIAASGSGVVSAVRVAPGDAVEKGAVLVEVSDEG